MAGNLLAEENRNGSLVVESRNIHVDWIALTDKVTSAVRKLAVALQCESKQIPPLWFSDKRLGIFNQFLHTYYTFMSTLDCKFLFNYLQLWRSYAILSETTHWIFDISLELNL